MSQAIPSRIILRHPILYGLLWCREKLLPIPKTRVLSSPLVPARRSARLRASQKTSSSSQGSPSSSSSTSAVFRLPTPGSTRKLPRKLSPYRSDSSYSPVFSPLRREKNRKKAERAAQKAARASPKTPTKASKAASSSRTNGSSACFTPRGYIPDASPASPGSDCLSTDASSSSNSGVSDMLKTTIVSSYREKMAREKASRMAREAAQKCMFRPNLLLVKSC